MRKLVLVAAVLSGCATEPRVYRYETLGFSVIATDPSTVDRACRGFGITKNDDGKPLASNSRVAGCFHVLPFDLDELWVSITDGVWVLLHELCHADGQPKEDCARIR